MDVAPVRAQAPGRFLAVCETLHFGRAAVRLHMSQPALSRAVRQLEDALGVGLFERHSRSVVLTDAGGRTLCSFLWCTMLSVTYSLTL